MEISMNVKNLFIYDVDEYKKYINLINNVFKTSVDLPENIFRDCYNNFLFEEFDWTMTEEFSEKLKQLTKETNDPFVLTAVIEPDPFDYYLNEFGYFNWFKIPTDELGKYYLEALMHYPEESVADSILYNSQKIVWIVPSAKWAIWGDRSYEICIFGCQVGYQIKNAHTLKTWETVENALEFWIKLSFKDQIISKDFRQQMIYNYKK